METFLYVQTYLNCMKGDNSCHAIVGDGLCVILWGIWNLDGAFCILQPSSTQGHLLGMRQFHELRKLQLGMRANLQFSHFHLRQKGNFLSVSTWEPMKVAQTKNS